ncbi:beta-tubulin cofactor d [Thozetella sp. PMI_491]|nr:beta-tubulin cofactor d [Thozetella sp. PMI_491]
MDAPEDDLDIKLQKISGDLTGDFYRSLPVLLRKRDGTLRSRVRSREVYRLASLILDPFQELPQLLDPHLPKWLPTLAEAYLEHLQTRRHHVKPLSLRSNLLMPLSTAICLLLYTLCKIRGEKVVVRFLNVEAKYLELLLAALEDAERAHLTESVTFVAWTWQERYMVLLWLSHLMLAPFDLATISSAGVEEDDIPMFPGFRWPKGLPGITIRIMPIALKYLASPGKERDAAKALLVRISMRKDMQQLGVLDALVRWALFTLRPNKDDADQTQYRSIGVLSYLAGVLRSSLDTSDMDKYIVTIFQAVHGIASDEDSESNMILSSALARKMTIKLLRSIAVLILRDPVQDMTTTELVETTIGYLLERLADNDTPVRLAASKALSIITLKLDTDMAAQVVEAVLEALNRNVLWVKNPHDPDAARSRDLTTVDALEWHGLMLTLSHLLYRRSPPPENLSDIILALIMGLSFEQRSASGISVGTNVRDAACFGIWSLGRRYTTSELLDVPTSRFSVSKSAGTKVSVLQILATELVVSACLDPAGNIRRGSSAALQELIGRHPDTVEQGIWVVQTVDYHAVARRSRAIQDVAMAATKLSAQYGEAILEALLGWRGTGNSDAAARRPAGASYGAITAELAATAENSLQRLVDSIALILYRVKSLQQREVEELHGLLLSFSAVLDSLPAIAERGKNEANGSQMADLVLQVTSGLSMILTNCKTKTYRRPELVAEAACRLIISSFPVLQTLVLAEGAGIKAAGPGVSLVSGPSLVSKTRGAQFSEILSALDKAIAAGHQPEVNLVGLIKSVVNEWLNRQEPEVVTTASEAGLIMLMLCGKAEREEVIRRWADNVRHRSSARVGTVGGYFAALAMSFPILSISEDDAETGASLVIDTIQTRWVGDKDIETRVAILQSLTASELLRQNAPLFLDLIAEGLDDYSTSARGDVGSHVRLEAIRATKSLWEDLSSASPQGAVLQASVSKLFLRILRLAAEKLDRVRVEAQSAVQITLGTSHSSRLGTTTFSSQPYFAFLLNLLSQDWLDPAISDTAKVSPEAWMDELLAGLVVSADTGNEELIIASRGALCDFCEASPANLNTVCTAMARNLKARQGNDRILVPTLEVIAFLFRAGLFRRCVDPALDYRGLCLQVQKAGYKTGNVRKIEACIRVYGAIAAGGADDGKTEESQGGQRRREGQLEARKRLGALMFHPWPRIRTSVVDELWGLTAGPGGDGDGDGIGAASRGSAAADSLKGVDWGKAEKGALRSLVEALDLC